MKMQFDFSGKRVLVTGGTSPIGRGTVEKFLSHGAMVAVQGPDQASVDELVDRLGGGASLIGVPGDLSKVADCCNVVDVAVKWLGGLDILVNASECRADIRFEDVSAEDWEQSINSTFKAATFCTQQAVNSLKASKGNIVNVATILGLMGGPEGSSVHAAAMGSVVNLTRMLALRFGVDGVRANCLCHGALTDSASSWGVAGADGTTALDRELKARPIGRLGTVDDMTPTILFLSSPYAGFMTGSVIVNDGGKYSGC